MPRQKFVAGNWKMHGSLSANLSLLSAVKAGVAGLKAQVAVCVPYPYLAQAQSVLAGGNVAWGAQDLSEHAQGAYTGEVSGSMLNDFGCRYVIIGHSERRSYYGDTDAVVAAKYAAALKAGLTPILCVGETLAEREANITAQVVTRQLDAVTAASGVASLVKAVVAYEPVWAIGTGKSATPAQAQAVHKFIRDHIAKKDAAIAEQVIIQYGGSVNDKNAAELFTQPDIDGALVGGASLKADAFAVIVKAAAAAKNA